MSTLMKNDKTIAGLVEKDDTFITLPSVSKTALASGATYIGETVFTVPTNAKRVIAGITTAGNVGGYVELFKGKQSISSDLGCTASTQFSWQVTGNIHISYIANNRSTSIDVTLYCAYQ